MSLEEAEGFSRRLVASESLRRKLPHETAAVREAAAKLSGRMRTIKKSEAYRQLEGLSQEGRLFLMARTHSEEVKKAVSNYITYMEGFRPLTTGEDLLAMGIGEGPVFREILEALKEAKIDRSFATKEQELAFVREYMNARSVQEGGKAL